MKNYKSFKEYYIKSQCYSRQNKIDTIKELLKMTKKEAESIEDWKKWRYNDILTYKQAQLFSENKMTELKKLLKKQLEKELKKLEVEKQEALQHYENIKALQDIKSATIEIVWTNRAGAYGYQCKAIGSVWYKNGSYNHYETENTGRLRIR